MALWRIRTDSRVRWATGSVEDGPAHLLGADFDLDAVLAGPGQLDAALGGARDPVPSGAELLAPLGRQEVWAAGVTYLRSRNARMEESTNPDHYDRIYDADRPEVFFKAGAERVRGHGQRIGVRADSTWDVPEPELGVVVDAGGRIVAYTIGNDVSSRSIEGENPLYLPQAKSFTGSCAIGPCLVPVGEAPDPSAMEITIRIRRGDHDLYADAVGVSNMKRRPDELVAWLYRALEFPVGAVLLTGTALVPGDDVTLRAGDEVTITISGLGTLQNLVEVVGAGEPTRVRA